MDAEEGEWQKAGRPRRQSEYGKERRRWSVTQTSISFYVSNLPLGCTSKDLAKEFGRFGTVLDAYVAKKKDRSGNHFGFVRFPLSEDAWKLERELNNIKMGSLKLAVNIAKFEKDGSRKDYHIPTSNPLRPKPKGFESESNIPKTNSMRYDGRSFLDVLKNQQQKESKAIVIPDNYVSITQSLWKLNSLIGRAKDLVSLGCINMAIDSVPGKPNARYLGGLDVLINFTNEQAAKDYLDNTNGWKDWFSQLVQWNGNSIPFERIAWVRIVGVPLALWDNHIIDKIGGSVGKVLYRSEASLLDSNLSVDGMAILVSNGDYVQEKVTVKWRNKSFVCHVVEDPRAWSPEFVSPNISGDVSGNSSASNPSLNGKKMESQRDSGMLHGEEHNVNNEKENQTFVFNAKVNAHNQSSRSRDKRSKRGVSSNEIINFKSPSHSGRPRKRPRSNCNDYELGWDLNRNPQSTTHSTTGSCMQMIDGRDKLNSIAGEAHADDVEGPIGDGCESVPDTFVGQQSLNNCCSADNDDSNMRMEIAETIRVAELAGIHLSGQEEFIRQEIDGEDTDVTQIRQPLTADLISDDDRSIAADSWSIKSDYGSTLDDDQRHADASEALAARQRAASDYSSDKEEPDAETIPSMLGFQSYWDTAYADELTNFREHGHAGEVWFGADVMEMVASWTKDLCVDIAQKQLQNHHDNENSEHSSEVDRDLAAWTVLDVGTGNGLLLQELAKQGFSDLTGTDYSEGAIDLAQSLADRDGFGSIKFLVDDILETKLDKKFHLVTDKGTLDAIGLHPDGPVKRIMYWESISRLVAPGGLVVITSCNNTKDELVQEVENFNQSKALAASQGREVPEESDAFNTIFSYLDHIRTYPTFMFGGSVGSRVTTVAFVRS
ncbi:hypothetical protein E3N88_20442 [Mikania micrantha]|uniref:Protein-lysine N-methyltransferase E3N88_20442 n=1 Tax=Mikania micrantha TaxID=192012 RepID=A0A5N6NI69_9ASTR|nr:hypothetical protein E3N88_20442 [Mikania micrantha]